MRVMRDSARVKVPASSGNLGPGFDSMGMAHDLWDEVSVRLTTGPTKVVVVGEGHDTVPKDDSHLIVRVIRETLQTLGLPGSGIELVCRNSIPHGRGLGSSAAAVVAGVMLVRELTGAPDSFTKDEVLNLATRFEGHPDNAAPAIFGGATVSWEQNGGFRTAQLAVSRQVRTSVLIPDEVLLTTAARAALPENVPHADAAFNAGRSALLVHALAGHPELLYAATEDRLHQDYRAEAMPHSHAMLQALRKAGWPAVISGAGPSILVFAEIDQRFEQILLKSGFRTLHSRQVEGAHAI